MYTLHYNDLPQHLIDDCDDLALMIGAIKPWHLDGQPLTDHLEQWFEDNWDAPVKVRHAIPFGA